MTDDRRAAVPVVLVVEDEPLLRMMAVDLVEEAGLAALEADSADAAIALLAARGDIGIVFTDIDLRDGADGLTLATTVRARWPAIGIVVTSGHLKPAAADLPAQAVFIAKPYPHDRMVATLRALAA